MAKYHGDKSNTFNGATVASNAPDPALPSKPNEGRAGDCSVQPNLMGHNNQSAPGAHVQGQPQNRPHGTKGSGTTHNTVGH